MTNNFDDSLVVSLPFSTSSHNHQMQHLQELGVVSLPFSTSSHNIFLFCTFLISLYLFPFLHQATTDILLSISSLLLYLFPFLHQATTFRRDNFCGGGCISSLFYIKPQLPGTSHRTSPCCISSLFYIKPQPYLHPLMVWAVVSLPFSTSSHNRSRVSRYRDRVVSLPFSTSSHNFAAINLFGILLYLFPFLHQATTAVTPMPVTISCISSLFYIKPQRAKSYIQFH